MDAEKAAKRRLKILASMPQEPVDWRDYREILDQAEPWEQVQYPKNFDWDIIRDVPLSAFPEATMKQVALVGDREERQDHKERIQEIESVLRHGGPVWPVVVDSDSGAIIDGWHRLVALRALGRESVDVLYS